MSATQSTESKAIFVIVGGLDMTDDRIEINVGPKPEGDPELAEWRQCFAEWKASQPSESETVVKLRARRDRWRKRAEDAERALEGALKVNEMYVGTHAALQDACCISMDLGHILDAACRQFGNVAHADLIGRIEALREALERRTEERDAALRDLDVATAKVGASARVRDALMCENGELRAELDKERALVMQLARELAEPAPFAQLEMAVNILRHDVDQLRSAAAFADPDEDSELPSDHSLGMSAIDARRETLREIGAMLDRMASSEPTENHALRRAAGRVWSMVSDAPPR